MSFDSLFVDSKLPQPFLKQELNDMFLKMENGDLTAREEIIRHNIKLVINEVIDLAKKKEFDGIYNIVLKQRKNVLEKLHKSQKKIDILDYFIENLKKINTTNNQKK